MGKSSRIEYHTTVFNHSVWSFQIAHKPAALVEGSTDDIDWQILCPLWKEPEKGCSNDQTSEIFVFFWTCTGLANFSQQWQKPILWFQSEAVLIIHSCFQGGVLQEMIFSGEMLPFLIAPCFWSWWIFFFFFLIKHLNLRRKWDWYTGSVCWSLYAAWYSQLLCWAAFLGVSASAC